MTNAHMPPHKGEQVDGDGLPFPDEKTIAAWRAEALRNPPDPMDVADLMVCLRWAAELDRQGVENPRLPAGMTAVERALNAVWVFLQKQPSLMRSGDAAPLGRLHAAIVDLADGRPSPLFKPVNTKRGNPGRSINYEIIQAFAARALCELIEAGEDPGESAGRVAKAVRAGRRDMPNVTHETVKNWRERLEQGPGPGASENAIFNYEQLKEDNLGDTPKQRGEALIKIIKTRGHAIG